MSDKPSVTVVEPLGPGETMSPVVEVSDFDTSLKHGEGCQYGGQAFSHCAQLKVSGTGTRLHCRNGKWEQCA